MALKSMVVCGVSVSVKENWELLCEIVKLTIESQYNTIVGFGITIPIMKQKGYHIPGPRYVRIWFKKRIQFQINRKYIIQYMILEKLESYLSISHNMPT